MWNGPFQFSFLLICYMTVWSGQKSHALDATHCVLALCLPHSHSVTLSAVVQTDWKRNNIRVRSTCVSLIEILAKINLHCIFKFYFFQIWTEPVNPTDPPPFQRIPGSGVAEHLQTFDHPWPIFQVPSANDWWRPPLRAWAATWPSLLRPTRKDIQQKLLRHPNLRVELLFKEFVKKLRDLQAYRRKLIFWKKIFPIFNSL